MTPIVLETAPENSETTDSVDAFAHQLAKLDDSCVENSNVEPVQTLRDRRVLHSKLIVAAGLSPAWQQIVQLPRLQVGEVNRAQAVHWCASGKVLNVGIALHHLAMSEPSVGFRCQTVSFAGGDPSRLMKQELDELGVNVEWVDTQHPTRVCTTILDEVNKVTTELVENPYPVDETELGQFVDRFSTLAHGAAVVVLTGSFPAGTPTKFFGLLMESTTGRIIIDAQGPALLAALEHRPYVIKPNREELGRTLGRSVDTETELRQALNDCHNRGAEWIVLSQGAGPVVLSSPSSFETLQPLPVRVINPIGCGDCLAAGIAWGLAQGWEMRAAVELGIRAAASNAEQLLPARIRI